MGHLDLSPADLHPADLERVFGGLQSHVVDDADPRHDEPQFQRRFAPDARDAVEELRALLLVHQRDEAVADLQGQWVKGDDGGHLRRSGLLPVRHLPGLRLGSSATLRRVSASPSAPMSAAMGMRRYHGNPGRNDNRRRNAAAMMIGPRLAGELLRDVLAEGGIRDGAGDDDSCRRRDEERGELRHETVADGKRYVGVQRRLPGFRVQRHTHDETADDLHYRDEDADSDVSRDELRGTVHGAVEIRFPLEVVLLLRCLFFAQEPRVVFGLDCHLFARQGVKGEPCGDLGNARCTLRYDDELHGNDDDENDDADDVAFDTLGSHDERREGPHDVAVELVALRKDEARGGNVQARPKTVATGGGSERRRTPAHSAWRAP